MDGTDLLRAELTRAAHSLGASDDVAPVIERPRDPAFGDWATNLAMVLAKGMGRKPRDLAAAIIERLDFTRAGIKTAEIAGPGFINFRVAADVFAEGLRALIAAGDQYGRSNAGEQCAVNVEFVSANPTGPLHVGHGRQAALGDAISALLGLQLLAFFGISIASFQVGGGMLLLISSLNMLNAQPAESKSNEEEIRAAEIKASLGASIAVVPLTIPLLTGPATMSTMVIYADKTQHVWELAILVGYGVVVGLVTGVIFSLADPIARVLGKTGINVMTRLMGLILAALSVEVMADGLSTLFPALARAH